MNPTIDILRAELERLFSLEDLISMSERLLDLKPDDVGGTTTKASFAKALTERCLDGDRIEALVDVVLATKPGVDARVRDAVGLIGYEEVVEGARLGPFLLLRKLREDDLSVVYVASRGEEDRVVRTLRREACRDRVAVQRFLTATRMVAQVDHPGLPAGLEAGEAGGIYWVSYAYEMGQLLRERLSRTGPAAIRELLPILRGIVQPLAALHGAGIVHGDLKLESAWIRQAEAAGAPPVTLIDAGGDRLRYRPRGNGSRFVTMMAFGSAKTTAPEQFRGLRSTPATDVYAFGAMLYELLTGKPAFQFDTATDAAIMHLTKQPDPPSSKAPRGWIGQDIDPFVLSMLAKDPERRPRNAAAVLEILERFDHRPESMAPLPRGFDDTRLNELIDRLMETPDDGEAAMELEQAVEEGASSSKVSDAFEMAAGEIVDIEGDHEVMERKKSLLYRAARIFDTFAGDKERAEKIYLQIVSLDPKDEVARLALDEVRRALGKFAEIVEALMARTEEAAAGQERARLFGEIGWLCVTELDDPEQGLLAYVRALCEAPTQREYVDKIEELAGNRIERWNEVLGAATEGAKADSLSSTERNVLLCHIARWYDRYLGRADLALLAFHQVLTADPAHEEAYEGLAAIYRKAQQWPELVSALKGWASAIGGLPRARDLRSEAAEVYEQKLSDVARAKELYEQILAEDPGHERAGDGLLRIAERTKDYGTLVAILDRRADARRGREKIATLLRAAQVYEDDVEDMASAAQRFRAALEIDPHELQALKGLDRIYNRTGQQRELLENLERQVAIAATPRQKINLYERMAALYDEEFIDHARSADCLEHVLAIDPMHEGALGALPRHYRALDEWEQLERLYENHAALVADPARKLELLMQRARVLAENIGSPDRATSVYEQALELSPGYPPALEALARVREQTGDAKAAVEAIETLAARAATPEAQAEQWLRAARLLEGHGDRDGAIERYKRALEAKPDDRTISQALRRAYAARGEVASVVALIEGELETADGKIAKARLYAELANLQRDKLRNQALAESNAKLAVSLDPTCTEALIVLGDIALESDRCVEARLHLEAVLGRVESLPKDVAVHVLSNYVEAYGRSIAARTPSDPKGHDSGAPQGGIADEHPKLMAAISMLETMASSDLDTRARIGRVLFDCGDFAGARASYETLLGAHGKDLSLSVRADTLWRLGESLRRLGELDRAVDALREAVKLAPTAAAPLDALARLYEQTGDWAEFLRTKQRRLETATGDERFDLLLEIGDVAYGKLNDHARAGKAFVSALEVRPDDRRVLTKLMQLYSEAKDWVNLVDIVLRLAEFLEDTKQRAKYLQTAAIITSRQLGNADEALLLFERALDFDPTLTKSMDEAIILRRRKGDMAGVERLLKIRLEQAKQAQDRPAIVDALDELGDLYRQDLRETDLAIDAYEAAQAFDPEGAERAELLSDLYSKDPSKYLDKAVKAQAIVLRRNPYRLQSYKLLRHLYTEARRPDPAWCVCQALSVLNRAEPDEERFYRKHRAETPAPAQAVLDEEDWVRRLAHPDADPLVTRLFSSIQPTIVRARAQSLESLGFDANYRMAIGPDQPYPIAQTLFYVLGVFGASAPPVFPSPKENAALGFAHALEPAIVLGRSAFDNVVANQALAFSVARHLAYFRPGYYVRHLVSTGTGLKAWLFAAIKLCVPQFPIAPDLDGQVTEALGYISAEFQGVQREMLASTVSKLLQSGAAIDLKKWVGAIDLTVDRAGFLVAHDLGVACEVIRGSEEGSSIPVKERIKELVLFSIGEEYLALRQKLRIGIDA
jgi:tetratricopeptide (TPR) repeat protein